MVLVQIYLPLSDNEGSALPRRLFDEVGAELTERFGGATSFLHAPAEGFWKADERATRRDEIVVVEAVCETLDRPWWRRYRATLEARFRQETVLIRAQTIEIL